MLSFHLVNAFSTRPDAGNPAAVGLLPGADWPSDEWMLATARGIALSETAFLLRLKDAPEGHWALRWFTPEVEDDLCGHATLAAAHLLFFQDPGLVEVTFQTRSGLLTARRAHWDSVELDFPVHVPVRTSVPTAVNEALGGEPIEAFSIGGLRDLILLFDGQDSVSQLRPDMERLASMGRTWGVRGFTCTAAAHAGHGLDFVSRFFSPHDGIPEDPVTGSAHTALAPLWAAKLKRDVLKAKQLSIRSGYLFLRVADERVFIRGFASQPTELPAAPGPA